MPTLTRLTVRDTQAPGLGIYPCINRRVVRNSWQVNCSISFPNCQIILYKQQLQLSPEVRTFPNNCRLGGSNTFCSAAHISPSIIGFDYNEEHLIPVDMCYLLNYTGSEPTVSSSLSSSELHRCWQDQSLWQRRRLIKAPLVVSYRMSAIAQTV